MSEYTSNKYICMYVSLQSSCINYCLLFSILCFRSRCVSFSAAICVLPSVRLSVCPTLLPWLLRFSCFYAALFVVVVVIIIIFMLYTWLVCLHFVVSSNQTQVIYICIYFTCAQRTKKSSKQKIKELINADAKNTHRHTRTRTQGQRRRAMGCSATKIGSSRQQWQ